MNDVYLTSYCNHAHRLQDGKPVEHECFVLPPSALAAERRGDVAEAIRLIQAGKTHRVYGEPQLKPHRGLRSS